MGASFGWVRGVVLSTVFTASVLIVLLGSQAAAANSPHDHHLDDQRRLAEWIAADGKGLPQQRRVAAPSFFADRLQRSVEGISPLADISTDPAVVGSWST